MPAVGVRCELSSRLSHLRFGGTEEGGLAVGSPDPCFFGSDMERVPEASPVSWQGGAFSLGGHLSEGREACRCSLLPARDRITVAMMSSEAFRAT